MLDFHNHILPDADDGSVSMDMSLAMLKTAAEQGITEVVNTIHYQHPKVEHRDINYTDTKKRLNEVQAELDKAGIPIKLHLGAEVFYLPNIMDLADNPLCTFENGKYMLIEFQVHQLPPHFEDKFFALKMAGVTPILAHPERYKHIQDDMRILEKLIRSGCVVQVDAGSICGTLGTTAHKASLEILKRGLCHIIGSDAHDDRRRNFCLKEAVDRAREIVGNAVEDMVNTNPRNVIAGRPIDTEVPIRPQHSPTLFKRFKQRIGRQA
ncbi:MAG: tyrosine-protein phosphatase [Fidelibacterota bacterium]